ncbi:F-box domain protein [Talaromyces stipitatus ATCC 10500]|uniref:F-box domain protein n=1 Tax=Talaromyces stipitatus (strain ATCC 10500 / CBS 375.48 / QM 6759 / NRRL 1006) TaxID=441959 RepID=B8M6S9_TALSN|nr:F-box domain protein [Talaromyces stipitatus ATCC 10500]EED20149.1 F-box domain protein [Talaromyces stipitatus ATCC 10500]
MASTLADEIVSSSAEPMSPASDQMPIEQPPKLKGRKRLLQNLQRMSSSPSLVRRTRSHSTGYQRDRKASLSCVSLSPAQCWGDPTTSIPGDLESASPLSTAGNARIRMIGGSPRNASQTTVPLPADLRPASSSRNLQFELAEEESVTVNVVERKTQYAKRTVDFWNDMPNEIKTKILGYLTPKEIIDTSEFYSKISSGALMKIITTAGPFVRDLNLRGCVQLREKWLFEGEEISSACRNVVNFSVEGCRIDKISLNGFFLRNASLQYINVSGLSTVTNSAMKIIAQTCPQLETLIVSWCCNVDTKGLKRVVESCSKLRDLRAGEIRGFDDESIMECLFEKNTLERLVLHRTDVTDGSLKMLMVGRDPEIDVLTDRPIVPPRVLRHLDIHQCTSITDAGLRSLAHNVPALQGLQISQCTELTDDSVVDVIQTTPQLSHFDMEDLDNVTNNLLVELAKSPCSDTLEHLNVSYCDSIGDIGMLQVLKHCRQLRSLEMDNTRVSDLCLMEASSLVRKRGYGTDLPKVGLRIVVFDCVNVTWAGVREVLSSNAYIPRSLKNQATVTVKESRTDSPSSSSSSSTSLPPPVVVSYYPKEIIELKCFHGWQMTANEHNKRVLRGSLASANNLDRKWADYMMATEEAGAGGANARRRRRRAREAERLYQFDEEEEDLSLDVYVGGRRRARSGGCTVM